MNKVGIVSSVQPDKGTATVIFDETGERVSRNLPVIVRGSYRTKDYWMPEPKEQVLCTFLSHFNAQGFIVGSFYSEKDRPPISNPKVRRIQFGDGAFIEYNQESQELIISFQSAPSSGRVIVQNGQIIDN